MRLLAEALDQPDAPAGFELADLQADRRLGEVERAGGGGKASLPHHFGERAQMVEVQVAHVKSILIKLEIMIRIAHSTYRCNHGRPARQP